MTNKRLIADVAALLAQPEATHPQFMIELDEELRRRGYMISAQQQGVRGTHLTVVPLGS